MKLLLALSLSLFASVSMACTDFSGSYRDEDSNTYTIAQSGCVSATVDDQEGTYSIIADGQYRVTEENDEMKISSAASFQGVNLVIDGKIEYKVAFPPEIPTEMIPVRTLSVYSLDSAGNLVMNIALYNSNNQVIGQASQTHQKI